ncbi:MAG: hypothetical protein CVV21_11830 [Candidatus Goldiibacteriota bacterium HGW-Goldbacteria-1]|jgi:hypothetical protein|nr:MAG: hypothetical protein CVV21_11830 [Candidatus Goldiibacteriota bacterium HGW-Goldbacteria-1]
MAKEMSKKQLLNSPCRKETIESAKQSLLQLMEPDNRVLFNTLTGRQQEELILEMAFEHHVIEIKEQISGSTRAN